MRTRTARPGFYRSMEWTRDACRQLGIRRPISYQIHAPLLIHKAAFLETMATVDALVMGRNTYDKVLTFEKWPTARSPSSS